MTLLAEDGARPGDQNHLMPGVVVEPGPGELDDRANEQLETKNDEFFVEPKGICFCTTMIRYTVSPTGTFVVSFCSI